MTRACEWCRGEPGEREIEVEPAKFGPTKEGRPLLKRAIVIFACDDCAGRLEHQKADAEAAAAIRRSASSWARRRGYTVADRRQWLTTALERYEREGMDRAANEARVQLAKLPAHNPRSVRA